MFLVSSLSLRAFYPATLRYRYLMVETRRRTRSVATNAVMVEAEAGPSRPRKKVKVEATVVVEEEELGATDTQRILKDETPEQTPKRKTQSKAKAKGKGKEVDKSTFIPRVDSLWKVGAHVSSAGGVENAVLNAAMIGANAFALFLKSQRKWASPPLAEASVKLFKERMAEYGYGAEQVLPHGSYLINLGNPDEEKRMKSYECFLDDLKRCEALGLKYYNFHPGSTVGATTPEESIKLIAQCLNDAHKETTGIVTVIENMAGAGNIIGSTFADIKGIIDGVEDKSRVGVCFDTCHGHSAGYDVSTQEGWESTMKKFEEEIGIRYLCGMHLNDSKTACGSRKDRHENIGMGSIGLSGFRAILTDPRTQGIPLILETPSFEQPVEVWGTEIRVLNELSTMGRPPTVGDSKEGGVQEEESKEGRMKELELEVREAVRPFVNAKDVKKALKDAGKGKAKKGSKRKRKGGESDEDEDEDGDE